MAIERSRAAIWEEFLVHDKVGTTYSVECTHCEHQFTTTGASRLNDHLLGKPGVITCAACPAPVRALYAPKAVAPVSSSQRSSVGIQQFFSGSKKDAADLAVAADFYHEGVAFHNVQTPAFQSMLDAVTKAGLDNIPPNVNQLRDKELDAAVKCAKASVQPLLNSAACTDGVPTGFSLCSNGWTDVSKHPLINILVTAAAGTVFLRAYNATGEHKTAEYLGGLIREQLLDLGADNCVLIVTDNAAACKAAGALLEDEFPHISWLGCLAHCMDLTLKDIMELPWAKALAKRIKSTHKLILHHQAPHALFGKHSPTLTLLLPGMTRFASQLLMMQRFIKVPSQSFASTCSGCAHRCQTLLLMLLVWRRSPMPQGARERSRVGGVSHRGQAQDAPQGSGSAQDHSLQVLRSADHKAARRHQAQDLSSPNGRQQCAVHWQDLLHDVSPA